MNIQKILNQIEKQVSGLYGEGKIATYIPELANIDPNQFSMSICFLDGKEYSIGNFNKKFSIQSISKVYLLTLAIKILKDKVWTRVGKEPSGNAFNSLAQLENENGIPRNPFINAGALVTTDAVMEVAKDPYGEILDFVKSTCNNNSISYNLEVANSEFETSHRNTALAFYMKSFNNINSDPMELIDVYCHHCSIEMTTLDLARSFLFLANNGINPNDNSQIVTASEAKRINSIMLTCGLYDNVGDFAYRVGLPAKSGVGGGIVAVMPGKFSVSVWSPELNPQGNSVLGSKALELLTNETSFSIF